jgi:hypothetical protein
MSSLSGEIFKAPDPNPNKIAAVGGAGAGYYEAGY